MGRGGHGIAQDHGDPGRRISRVVRWSTAGLDGAGRTGGGGRSGCDGGGWGALGDGRHGGRFGAGRVGAAGCCGAGAVLFKVGRRAALPGVGTGQGGKAEVAADLGDDVGDRAVADVLIQVGGVEAVVQFGGQSLGAGFIGVGSIGSCIIDAGGGALDRVLDFAEDALAGGGAVLGRVPGGRDGVGEAAR